MTTSKNKRRLLEALKENHMVLRACRKTGIGKSSYYRWLKQDSEFALAAEAAIQERIEDVNNDAEELLIAGIKNGDSSSAKFWLNHHHPTYSNKLKIESSNNNDVLSPEQEAKVRKALEFDIRNPKRK